MTRPLSPRAGYIATAARQFAAQGYHGASLAAVARDAGVTKQALLHFFGSKDRLYAEVLTDLADRLSADIDAAHHPEAADHLDAYVTSLYQQAMQGASDARLVVRALLDSDGTRRRWPMKPYLDRLVALVRATPRGRSMTDTAALAWVFQQIGMTQYLTISTTAISAMYGPTARDEVGDQMLRIARDAVAHLRTPVPG